MPILGLPNTNAKNFVDSYMNSVNKPIAFEFTVKSDTIKFLKEFKKLNINLSSNENLIFVLNNPSLVPKINKEATLNTKNPIIVYLNQRGLFPKKLSSIRLFFLN